MIRFGERVAIFFLRPIYRGLIERPIWWFIARIKIFFLAEIGPQLESIGRQLEAERQQRSNLEVRLHAVEERLRSIDDGNRAQWDALEQLLLALYRQSEPQSMEMKAEIPAPSGPAADWNTDNKSRVHAAGNLR